MELTEYHYVYYSYEEYHRGYIGSRTCKCLPEEDVKYFGSFYDKTFKPTQKIILKSDYTTREEAYADEIILQRYYEVVENSHFANRAYQTSTKFCLSKENLIKLNMKQKELGIGIHAKTPEQRRETSRKSGLKCKENGTGIFSLTPEKRSQHSRNIGLKCKENGTGFYNRTSEQHSEDSIKGGKNTSSQRWECLETGFIANAANLSRYQNARGIDTSKRERVA
jgi:ethanolamine utilization microcompartment shell protein EutS